MAEEKWHWESKSACSDLVEMSVCLSVSRVHTYCVFMIATGTSHPEDNSLSQSSPFGPHNPCTHLPRCALGLRGGDINVPFEVKRLVVP